MRSRSFDILPQGPLPPSPPATTGATCESSIISVNSALVTRGWSAKNPRTSFPNTVYHVSLVET